MVLVHSGSIKLKKRRKKKLKIRRKKKKIGGQEGGGEGGNQDRTEGGGRGGEQQKTVVETKILTPLAKPALKTVLETSVHFQIVISKRGHLLPRCHGFSWREFATQRTSWNRGGKGLHRIAGSSRGAGNRPSDAPGTPASSLFPHQGIKMDPDHLPRWSFHVMVGTVWSGLNHTWHSENRSVEACGSSQRTSPPRAPPDPPSRGGQSRLSPRCHGVTCATTAATPSPSTGLNAFRSPAQRGTAPELRASPKPQCTLPRHPLQSQPCTFSSELRLICFSFLYTELIQLFPENHLMSRKPHRLFKSLLCKTRNLDPAIVERNVGCKTQRKKMVWPFSSLMAFCWL